MDYFRSLTVILVVFNFYLVNCVKEDDPSCHSCPAVTEKINVHLIPHSHIEEGWVKTFGEYYSEAKSILDSTVAALKNNASRRFVLAEIAFFSKWWKEQKEDVRKTVTDLVNNGQLQFVNGGWSLSDEATSHYQSIIDQFTLGFKFLNDAFGTCGVPTVGWQIHAFGHSRQHASILKEFGFEGLVIGPISDADMKDRQKNKDLDFNWKTSTNLDDSAIFTTIFPNSYNWETDFDFEHGDSITEENKDEKIAAFIERLNTYKIYYKTNNIIIPMGGDLAYTAAEDIFRNIEALIVGVNTKSEDYNLFYSTPSCYVKAVKDAEETLEQKEGDFFPYASAEDVYWTGYYTSRPTLKRFERLGHNILQSVNQLTSLATMKMSNTAADFTDLKKVMGVLQHHQAITGTAKQAVVQNYVSMLHQAIKKTEEEVGTVISTLLKKNDVDLKLSTCLLSNVSICEISQKDRFLVVVHNPLSKVVTHYVRLPVNNEKYAVTGPDKDIKLDIFDTIHEFSYITGAKPSTKELVFEAKDLPPLGVKVYYVENVDEDTASYHPFELVTDGTYGNELNGFVIKEGALESINIQGETQKVKQEFRYYPSTSEKPSNAYVFKPTASAAPLTESAKPTSTKCAAGTLVDECLQIFNNDVRQIIRVYKGEKDNYVEFDWLVGNLNNVDEGKDVITRFTITDFTNGGKFFTDSNGREQMERNLNAESSEQLKSTSNYYPVTSKIAIQDENKKIRVAILNDRPQGGTSLENGVIELMIHRREIDAAIDADDGGLDETLNEQEYGVGLYVRGQHYLTFGSTETDEENVKAVTEVEKDIAYRKLLAPWVLLADATDETLNSTDKVTKLLNLKYEGLKNTLPDNIQILTLEPWENNTYLLRLEHTYEKDEHKELSSASEVQIKNLFKDGTVTKTTEVNLGATKQLNTKNAVNTTLNSMEVKTFIIEVTKPSGSSSQPLRAICTVIVFLTSLYMVL